MILENKFPLPNLDVLKVYLFGNYNASSKNDIDLLIICDDFDGVSRMKRMEKVLLNFSDEKVDPVCITSNEFTRLLQQKSLFITIALKKSLLIYEK
ncbi:nucleotidyltransferase domain-containing protein [Mucilaginibacter polytrichastri]|uniref:nucleotidyltransferase domain-containing protein n=1 Tax=Mucilaginibacter polytrichastri TaxID=1302689 RepID=UPI0008DEDE47|nr:nucleotidyltransferase domain-containing protein [Mucilaginibacter polytrichastri]SFS95683.1 hypothetical protein SAMN04487890_10781 [Mucilaginibacter polytrichastri]